MGLRAWLREPITIEAEWGAKSMEAFGRASAGLPARKRPVDDQPRSEAARRYRSAIPPIVMPRWRFWGPFVATCVAAAGLVALGAFILLHFG